MYKYFLGGIFILLVSGCENTSIQKNIKPSIDNESNKKEEILEDLIYPETESLDEIITPLQSDVKGE